MSRIHEALKKAEQDRSASLVERKLEEAAELRASRRVVQIATESEVVPAPPALPESKAPENSGILTVDDLRAKCVKTTWNLDPNFLVFSSSKEFPAGAE